MRETILQEENPWKGEKTLYAVEAPWALAHDLVLLVNAR